jgi:anhydro-N-acetylmuramic acid kinase
MVPLKAIGLMSGTSLAGSMRFSSRPTAFTLSHTGPTVYRPYSPPERDLLPQALADASALLDRRARLGSHSRGRASRDPDPRGEG